MRQQRHDERGTGVVGTAIGAAVFLAFLLLSTHTLLSLYASSIISATAWDTARAIRDTENATTAQHAARDRLNGFKNVTVEITQDDNDVVVHIQADRPMFLPVALANSTGLGRIDKTVHARTERWQ